MAYATWRDQERSFRPIPWLHSEWLQHCTALCGLYRRHHKTVIIIKKRRSATATCKHKAGFLSLRDCGNPVNALCQTCNRPVCAKHYRIEEDSILCLECIASRTTADGAAQHNVQQEYERRQTYRDSGYTPYYYGHSERYGQDDYKAFDTRPGTPVSTSGGFRGSVSDAEALDAINPDDFQDS